MLLRSATLTTPSCNLFRCAHAVTFPRSQPFAGGRRYEHCGSECGTLASPLPRLWGRTVPAALAAGPNRRTGRAAAFIWETLRAAERRGAASPGSFAGLRGAGGHRLAPPRLPAMAAAAASPPRRPPSRPRPPRDPLQARVGWIFLFWCFFFFFLFPFSCSETFSYVHFSPVELIYELGLARAGVAGPSAGRAARGRGAPAGLPSRGSARLPARHEL